MPVPRSEPKQIIHAKPSVIGFEIFVKFSQTLLQFFVADHSDGDLARYGRQLHPYKIREIVLMIHDGNAFAADHFQPGGLDERLKLARLGKRKRAAAGLRRFRHKFRHGGLKKPLIIFLPHIP